MQKEFYIGQKVKTSQVGIEKGCYEMEGVIIADRPGKIYSDCFDVKYLAVNGIQDIGIFMPEEIEPIEDSSVSEVVFDNIASILQ